MAQKDQNKPAGDQRRAWIMKHDQHCAFHLDQYPWECDCGAVIQKAAKP
jgi:uncharacterized protein YecT (DUF1311 family)